MSNIVEMTVEIVKAQATQRRMSAQEIEEYIRRTAAALQSIASAAAPQSIAPAAAPPAEPEESAAAPAGEGWLTVQEAAKALGRTTLTVYKYIRQGKLPAQRAGRTYKIRPEDVQALKGTLRRRVVVRPRRRPVRRPVARRTRVARRA